MESSFLRLLKTQLYKTKSSSSSSEVTHISNEKLSWKNSWASLQRIFPHFSTGLQNTLIPQQMVWGPMYQKVISRKKGIAWFCLLSLQAHFLCRIGTVVFSETEKDWDHMHMEFVIARVIRGEILKKKEMEQNKKYENRRQSFSNQ